MSRFAFVTVMSGALSCAGLVYGQESTAPRQEPATTPTGSTSSTTATQEEGPPRGTGSMAGVGQMDYGYRDVAHRVESSYGQPQDSGM
jgi:hypothetical protein